MGVQCSSQVAVFCFALVKCWLVFFLCSSPTGTLLNVTYCTLCIFSPGLLMVFSNSKIVIVLQFISYHSTIWFVVLQHWWPCPWCFYRSSCCLLRSQNFQTAGCHTVKGCSWRPLASQSTRQLPNQESILDESLELNIELNDTLELTLEENLDLKSMKRSARSTPQATTGTMRQRSDRVWEWTVVKVESPTTKQQSKSGAWHNCISTTKVLFL